MGNRNSGRRPVHYPPELVAEIHEMRDLGATLKQISLHVHLSPTTISKLAGTYTKRVFNKGAHGRAQSYKRGCHCDYCRAAVTYAAPMGDPRVAVECWCHARMQLVTMRVIVEGRTISCGSPACRRIEREHQSKIAA